MTFFWEAIDFWFLYGNRVWQWFICSWSWKNEIHWFREKNSVCLNLTLSIVSNILLAAARPEAKASRQGEAWPRFMAPIRTPKNTWREPKTFQKIKFTEHCVASFWLNDTILFFISIYISNQFYFILLIVFPKNLLWLFVITFMYSILNYHFVKTILKHRN